MPSSFTLVVEAIAGALLIGLLIGAQREAAGGDRHPGLRDFLLISLAGGICGVLKNPWLDAAALLSIAAVFAVLHYEQRLERAGITTELAAITTFLLALIAANSDVEFARPMAIGITIVVALFLEARQRLHELLRTTILEREFHDTLGFVAVILVIYPLLPAGAYGPYGFFEPRQVWVFVILISSISYIGYFLTKFLGNEKGLLYTSILGGLASTTAVTVHLGRMSREQPSQTIAIWRAFVIANTVQFPRTALIVLAANPELAKTLAWSLAAMTLLGIVLSEVLRRWPHKRLEALDLAPGNPFRIRPALQFGLMFTAVVFISKAASARLGTQAFLATSLLGGLVDVATVIAPAADLLRSSQISLIAGGTAVLMALASNALLKLVVSAAAGTRAFAISVAASFLLWSGAGATAWWIAIR